MIAIERFERLEHPRFGLQQAAFDLRAADAAGGRRVRPAAARLRRVGALRDDVDLLAPFAQRIEALALLLVRDRAGRHDTPHGMPDERGIVGVRLQRSDTGFRREDADAGVVRSRFRQHRSAAC